jgi:hypothetical protein
VDENAAAAELDLDPALFEEVNRLLEPVVAPPI